MTNPKFTEKDLQHGALMAMFTDSPLVGGLGWMAGVESDVDKSRWVVRKDLIAFLKNGTPQNAKSYELVMKSKKHKNDFVFYDDFCIEALDPLLRSEYNAAYILPKTVVYAGQNFTLYNAAPLAGDSNLQSAAFERNCYRVIPEVTFVGQYQLSKATLNRRPDLVMFVNGLYYSYCEVKATQRKQSSSKEGRAKIARDVIDAVVLALTEGRARYIQKTGTWPVWSKNTLPVAEKDAIEMMAYPFLRAVHLSTVDMHEFWVLNDLDWLLVDIEKSLRDSKNFALSVAERDRLVAEITAKFQRAPHQAGMTPFDNVKCQLRTWFSPKWGIDADISLFNYMFKKRTTVLEPMRVRAAQRMMLAAGLQRIETLYRTEHVPKIHGPTIAQQLKNDLPMLGAKETQDILEAATSYQNGKDAFSVLLQGAAGLGKTNVMVWMARMLTGFVDPKSNAGKELFDSVIVLTDRTELRKSMAEEASRMSMNRGVFKEAKTLAALIDCLQTARVTVVNIQKFPGIVRHLDDPKNAKVKEQFASQRVAFIIDEIHRSQSGEYHDATMDIFDSIAQLGMHTPGQVVRTVRNVVIGFTATPRDELLARFGEWRGPKSPGDRIQWIPYYSYSVNQAIEDGIVLDVKQHVVPFASVIEYDAIESERQSGDDRIGKIKDEAFYENPERIAFISGHIAKIFASTTIFSGRVPNGKGYSTFGDGKAMVVAYSIKSAIAYHEQIREALDALAQDPLYVDRKDVLLKTPVLIVFSDTNQDSSHKSRVLNQDQTETQVIDDFRRKKKDGKNNDVKNAIIIVVDKLLTGFDEPSLHTLFVDKGLNDVLLLQAFYRVGRIDKYKTNCLIVDFSRDNVVSSRVKGVFEKYGGMTVSQFDAMPIEDRMNEAYRRITEKELKALFKAWKTTRSTDRVLASATLQAAIRTVVQTTPQEAVKWQEALSSWLGTTLTLKCILDFTQPSRVKHWDHELRIFAREALNELNYGLDIANAVVQPVFEITGVDLIDGYEDELSLPALPEKASISKPDAEYPTVGGKDHEQDILEFISGLQNESNQHLTNIERVKHGLSVLFTAIDAIGKTSNNDIFVKKIHQRAAGTLDEPYDERIREFHKLFNKACMQKNVRDVASASAWKNLWALESKLLDDYETWVLGKM